MATWTDLANLPFKAVLASSFINQLLDNVRWLREDLRDGEFYSPTFTSGWEAFPGAAYVPRFRRMGKLVVAEGLVRPVGGGTAPAGTEQILTVPSAIRPSGRSLFFDVAGSTDAHVGARAVLTGSSGLLTIGSHTFGTASAYWSLANIVYTLD